MGQDEKYKEIVLVGDKEVLCREGTIKELIAQEKLNKPKSPIMASKASVDDVIKVSKFVWDIIKDSKASAATEATTSRVLSVKDDNWQNYELAKDFNSDVITYKLDNFYKKNCYTVKFKVAGTFRAVNHAFGGKWIPNVHITFISCDASFPWIINGNTKIDSTFVSNKGTKEAPIPQLVLNVKIKTDAKFVFGWESHERTFEFNLNGEDGVKLIN